MFEDPDLPDFDSMSQEELIDWLEELTKLQSGLAPAVDEDGAADDEPAPADPAAITDDEWSEWLDDAQPPEAEASAPISDNFAEADEETPVDLARFDERANRPLDADAMAWLAEISATDGEEELPDITDYAPPPRRAENLDDLLAASPPEDPLDWLEELGGAGPRLPIAANGGARSSRGADDADADPGAVIDDAYEDDERLDDLEDESLYSRRPDQSLPLRASLLGLDDRESEEYSTQSMAPVPENMPPATDEPAPAEEGPFHAPALATEAADSLTHAFLPQHQAADLEAWYKSRLRALALAGDGASSAAGAAGRAPVAAPSKPPPPGLAAAINSARGKVEADELREALTDYETLLRTNAGLEWVVDDMRGLIAQSSFRANPSVHRVLGDALMRQGRLSEALDVYRHALSLL